MTLLSLAVNEKAIVTGIKLSRAVKNRLSALGVTPKSEVVVKQYGLFKSTVQIAVGEKLIGLRKAEAESIEISTPYKGE